MEEERNKEEFKHVCRLCNKRFPSGKSLGGHMRSHVIAEARKNKLMSSLKKVQNFVENEEEDDEDDIEIIDRNGNLGNNNLGYGLRENPKKTWRIVDSKNGTFTNNNYPAKSLQGNNNKEKDNDNECPRRICKKCGKGFHSLKALCGHMSIHSEKDRKVKEEDEMSWSSESFSDNNNNINNNSKRQTRSSMSRYKSVIAVNGFGFSSNRVEIDQLEQEEVAMCLMMLSRDTSGSFNSAAESSDNNSVILEGGSCRNAVAVVAGAGAGAGKGKRSLDVDCDNVDHDMDNSDSGYFENGASLLESVDGFGKNFGLSTKSKFDLRSRLVDCFGDDDDDDDNVGSFGFDSPESILNYPSKKIKYHSKNNSPRKVITSDKYECWICNKTFKTHQALGGHIISHRKNVDNYNSSKFKSEILATTKKGGTSKKIKGHKCPCCPRIFKSGQALGGHKRTHMLGSNNFVLHSEGRLSHFTAPPSPPEFELRQPLIDLNLPAPVDEEVIW